MYGFSCMKLNTAQITFSFAFEAATMLVEMHEYLYQLTHTHQMIDYII